MSTFSKITVLIALVLIVALLMISVVLLGNITEQKIYPDDYSDIVEKYAEEFGIDKYLIHSIIWVESSYDKNAVSSSGARGLMQISEGTLPDINVMLGELYSFDDMFDPEINVRCGVCYLNYLFKRFGDMQLVIAAYNGGPTNVASWLKNEEYSDGERLIKIPIEQTERYVNKVNACYEKYAELYKNE